jgi:hypothetical protein
MTSSSAVRGAILAGIASVSLVACSSADPGGGIGEGPAIDRKTVPAVIIAGDAEAAARDAAPSNAVDAGPVGNPTAGDGGCMTPNMVCNGVCVAVTEDVDNCGKCGNACGGPNAVCLSGQCGCGAAGLDYCVGVGCMDVTSDINNCGSCGNVCDPNQFTQCQDGQCVP